MARICNGVYCGFITVSSRHNLYMNIDADLVHSGDTIYLNNISCYMYMDQGSVSYYSQASRTWGITDQISSCTTTVNYTGTWSNRSFTLNNCSFPAAASATSRTLWITGPDGLFGFDIYFPVSYTQPSQPSVAIQSKTHSSVTFSTSISSYGIPASTDGRYIEAAILGQNSYGASYRYATARNTTSATITVDNSSGASPSTFIIEGNHKYWYGGYATNTQASNSIVTGSFYTPCPPLSALSLSSQAYSTYDRVDAVISYTRQSDGGAETRTGYYRYSVDNETTYSEWVSFGTISGTTDTFTISLPTSKNVILQAKITTPNGGDSAVKSASFSTKTTHIAPNFSNFTYKDNNSATVALTGSNQAMIQRQSIPLVTISRTNRATGNDGVDVSNYAITFVGQSKTVDYSSSASVTATLDVPSDAGTSNLVVSAVDTLSLSKSVSKSVTIYPWSEPIVSASIERRNNFESESTLSISGTYSPIKVGNTAKNTITVAYRTKKSSSSTWGSWTNRTVTVSDNEWETPDLSIVLDNNYQWDVQVRAVDKFVTTTADLILSVGIPNFFIGVDGRVSVGMRPDNTLPSSDRGQIEVNGPVYSRGEPLMPSHIGQIIMTTTLDTAAKVKAIYGGTWVQWGKGRVLVGMGSNGTSNYDTVESTGGEESHRLTVSEMPQHSHPVEGCNGFIYADTQVGEYVSPGSSYWMNRRASISIGNTGGNESHENRQPYITAYMWKRTA